MSSGPPTRRSAASFISGHSDMKTIINLGLAVSGAHVHTAEQALVALARERVSVIRYDTFVSDTELTLVAEVDLPAVPDTRHPLADGDFPALYRVAQRLQQDCIAVWDETLQRGQLVGPRASAWGTFNPSFFLNLDGSRLQ